MTHPLVRAEWPDLPDVPAYDYAYATDRVHVGVYVRRVAGDGWFTLAGLVNHVVVAPNLRGEGLGSAAVATAAEWLARVRVPFAILHCEQRHTGFYGRLGFVAAPNFPAPTHRGYRVSMVAELTERWPDEPVRFVEPW